MQKRWFLYQLERADWWKMQCVDFIFFASFSSCFLPENSIAFLVFQMWRVREALCTTNVASSWMTSASEGLLNLSGHRWTKKKTKAERSELLSLLDAQREDSWYFTGAQEYWLFLSRRQVQGWKSLGYLRFWMSLWVKCKDNSAYEIPSKCWILIVALYFVHQTAKGHLGNPGW